MRKYASAFLAMADKYMSDGQGHLRIDGEFFMYREDEDLSHLTRTSW